MTIARKLAFVALAATLGSSFSVQAEDFDCSSSRPGDGNTLSVTSISPNPIYVTGSAPYTATFTVNVSLPGGATSLRIDLNGTQRYFDNTAPIESAATLTNVPVNLGTNTLEITATKAASPADITAECEGEIEVQIEMVVVEFRAPPAIANAYINGDLALLPMTNKQRGCVISKIADKHAKLSAYGPKGGLENINGTGVEGYCLVSYCNVGTDQYEGVHTDVDAFLPECGVH